ncbi:MAG: hypothetical protein M3N50_12545 [Pseudomonadota bacterium]|nr:hypothetical protein [Pseudomonadota bacterium]
MKLTTLMLVTVGCAMSTIASSQPPAGMPPPPGGMPDIKAIIDSLSKPCATDLKTTCAGKEGMEEMMCLVMNQEKLTPSCKDAMGKLPRPPGG